MSRKMFRYKGRLVSEKNYNHIMKKSEIGKLNKGRRVLKVSDECQQKSYPVLGTRIINMEYLSKSLICKSCGIQLLLQNIVKEKIEALGSYFKVRCHKCEDLSVVTSSELFDMPSGCDRAKKGFVINSKVALGNFVNACSYKMII